MAWIKSNSVFHKTLSTDNFCASWFHSGALVDSSIGVSESVVPKWMLFTVNGHFL